MTTATDFGAGLRPPPWTLTDRLRKARESVGLNQTELADEIGISRRSVSNYEAGLSKPNRPVLLSWAFRCAVPLSWLETGEENDESPRPDPDEGLSVRHQGLEPRTRWLTVNNRRASGPDVVGEIVWFPERRQFDNGRRTA